jgi:hypothetical protein
LEIDGSDVDRMTDALPSEVILNIDAYPIAERDADLASMVARWSMQQPTILFGACVANNAIRLAEGLVPKNWRDNASWAARMAMLRAAQGRLTDARKILSNNDKAAPGGGAIPLLVSQAQSELARRTSGFEQEMWRMLAALNRPAALAEELVHEQPG